MTAMMHKMMGMMEKMQAKMDTVSEEVVEVKMVAPVAKSTANSAMQAADLLRDDIKQLQR